jgi:uncharacterized protein
MDIDQLSDYFRDRLNRRYLEHRIGIEDDNEALNAERAKRSLAKGNLPSQRILLEWMLRLSGTQRLGAKNANNIKIRTNIIKSSRLPQDFNGFRILHLSDLHADISEPAMKRLSEVVRSGPYDICVMTGDYRGKTWGPYSETLDIMKEVSQALKGNVYAVLGNHDSIGMVPDLEKMGIQVLINENRVIQRGQANIHVAGIDDAHHFRLGDVDKVASVIPQAGFSILLSHTPEIYRHAADAKFDLMLSGHTHGGQICLPGGFPLRLDCAIPRKMGSGAWTYGPMAGYTSPGAGTSIVRARFNCYPEITFHQIERP